MNKPCGKPETGPGTQLQNRPSGRPEFIPAQAWAECVRRMPLVSMDLIVSDEQGRVLVGYRNNRPAQHTWFVPGGVVRKYETLNGTFARLLADELNLELSLKIKPDLSPQIGSEIKPAIPALANTPLNGSPAAPLTHMQASPLDFDVEALRTRSFSGVYEHHYPDNFSGEDFGTHYVVMAHRLTVGDLRQLDPQWSPARLPNQQHAQYQWLSPAQMLSNPQVHINTQAYFNQS